MGLESVPPRASTSATDIYVKCVGFLSRNRGVMENRLGSDVLEATSLATPRQRVGVSTWTFNPVDTVSLEVVLAEMGRFKATQRSLSPFKWSLIAWAPLVAACM